MKNNQLSLLICTALWMVFIFAAFYMGTLGTWWGKAGGMCFSVWAAIGLLAMFTAAKEVK